MIWFFLDMKYASAVLNDLAKKIKFKATRFYIKSWFWYNIDPSHFKYILSIHSLRKNWNFTKLPGVEILWKGTISA